MGNKQTKNNAVLPVSETTNNKPVENQSGFRYDNIPKSVNTLPIEQTKTYYAKSGFGKTYQISENLAFERALRLERRKKK